MYTTRRLSELRRCPGSVSKETDGPNSGYLVIQDEESETYSFFGLFKNHSLKNLPFPQNKNLSVVHSGGQNNTSYYHVVLIPVLNLPLSANRYYAIQPHGNHKGEAFTCSREEDMIDCCFFPSIKDVKPMPLDPTNIYQQIEIFDYTYFGKGYYRAKSIAADGFPTYFLRRKGWTIRTRTHNNYQLDEAPGLDAALRARLPEFAFPLSLKRSETSVIVGKWYCPFMFINEGTLRYQMETSMFYKITLEQRWEQIYACTNNDITSKLGNVAVDMDVTIDRETAYVAGGKAKWNDDRGHGKIIFTNNYGVGEEAASVGLSVELVQRMKWEQARGGFSYDGGVKRQDRVKRVENFEGIGQWGEFGCYVLVESFVIRRFDGTLLLVYEFWHTHQIRNKWL